MDFLGCSINVFMEPLGPFLNGDNVSALGVPPLLSDLLPIRESSRSKLSRSTGYIADLVLQDVMVTSRGFVQVGPATRGLRAD